VDDVVFHHRPSSSDPRVFAYGDDDENNAFDADVAVVVECDDVRRRRHGVRDVHKNNDDDDETPLVVRIASFVADVVLRAISPMLSIRGGFEDDGGRRRGRRRRMNWSSGGYDRCRHIRNGEEDGDYRDGLFRALDLGGEYDDERAWW
jgi:hypothetical protein